MTHRRAHEAIARSVLKPALGAALVAGTAAASIALAGCDGCSPKREPMPVAGTVASPTPPSPSATVLLPGVFRVRGSASPSQPPPASGFAAARGALKALEGRPARATRRFTDPDARARYAAFIAGGHRAMA